MSSLHGLLNAIVTPFTPSSEEVDEPNLRSIVDYGLRHGEINRRHAELYDWDRLAERVRAEYVGAIEIADGHGRR